MNASRITRLTWTAVLAVCATSTAFAKDQPYKRDDISFTLSDGWTVTEDKRVGKASEARYLTVEGPESAIIAIVCLPTADDRSLEQIAADMANDRDKSLAEQLHISMLKVGSVSRMTSQPTTRNIEGQVRAGIQQGFNMSILGVQLPFHEQYFLIPNSRWKLLITYEVADEDAVVAKKGAELLFNTLQSEHH